MSRSTSTLAATCALALLAIGTSCTSSAPYETPSIGPEQVSFALAAPAAESEESLGRSERAERSVQPRERQVVGPSPATACPADMVLVQGSFCPEVEQHCLKWLDPPGPYEHFRCAEYDPHVTCKSERRAVRYCIDRFERAEEETGLPRHFMSYTSSAALCQSVGARLCQESEWIFACEGEEMRPYPYGWKRDASACNVDISKGLGRTGNLVDHRAKGGAFPRCQSSFGVYDLSGNVEEWTTADSPKYGFREVMKGSWWIPSRHACRQFQVGHDSHYNGGETGARCCRDAE